MGQAPNLVDAFGRTITYLRISVTDRCDFRCTYCMAENMTFLPRRDVLSFEEIETIARAFVKRGVTKIRLTGGEPLVRRDIAKLLDRLGGLRSEGLSELTLTTNGNQLEKHAVSLHEAGVRRINVSLDTLDEDRFRSVTRWGKLENVLSGIRAAAAAGLSVKINTVALRSLNEDELGDMVAWAHGEGHSITFIETMPMGQTDRDRADDYLPLSVVKERLAERFTLSPLVKSTGGPARYFRSEATRGDVGFITPLTYNFCAGCNRVRLTAKGELFMCLGQGDHVDLRALVRQDPAGSLLDAALDEAMRLKPEGHDFTIERGAKNVAVDRHMSVTGG
ncbi:MULTISPECIES: GTP 3',8-cyclase MoaA [Pacificimonas]|nr:GTP 3',8-cyclase MoaA [Pacificimonas aurantium]